MTADDINAKYRDFLADGAKVEGASRDAQASVRPRADYVQAVRDFFGGRLPTNAVLEMGRPGEILRGAGLEDLPIRIRQSVLRAKTGKHPELNQELLERLPELINKPLFVFDATGDRTGKAIVAEHRFSNGRTLTVYANTKVDSDGVQVHRVKTVFGKDAGEIVSEILRSPRLRYADAEKGPAWVRHSARLDAPSGQLPAMLAKIKDATQSGEGQAPQFASRGSRRPLTDDERLARAKQALARRRDDLLRRVAAGDLTRVKRERVQLDAEGLKLQAEHQRAKQSFDEAVEKDRRAKLPFSVRAAEHASGLARAGAISGFFGRLHDAEKTPLFTGAMEAYRTKAYANAIRQGINPADPMVRGLINAKSYEYALRDKLQEQNDFADGISRFHQSLERVNPVTKRANTTKVLLSTLAKIIVTKGIVKTPANYLKQTLFEQSPIGLIRAFAEGGAAHIRGVENLTDAEANHIQAQTAALLREKAAELRTLSDPKGRKSTRHMTHPVALHHHFIERAAEYGISPLYLARLLCEKWATSPEPPDELVVSLQVQGGTQEVAFRRTVDDSKLVLNATAEPTGLTADLK